jgi:hypothetical protein
MGLQFPPDFPFHRSIAEEPTPVTEAPAAAVEPAPQRPTTRALKGPHVVMRTAAPLPQTGERRRGPRQTLVAKAAIRPDSPVHVPSLVQAGFVSNISMNGVGFHTRKPLAIGEKYRITLELGPMKWSSRFRVVSCQHHEDSETFDVGAEFIGNELTRQLQAA